MPPPITNTSDVVDDAPPPFALLSALAAGDVVAEREATAKTAADAPDMPEKRRLSMLGECTQHEASCWCFSVPKSRALARSWTGWLGSRPGASGLLVRARQIPQI